MAVNLAAENEPNRVQNKDPFSDLLCRNSFFADKVYGIKNWEKTDWQSAFGDDPEEEVHWDVWVKTISEKDYKEKYQHLSTARNEWIECVHKTHNVAVLTRIKVIATDDKAFILAIGVAREKK